MDIFLVTDINDNQKYNFELFENFKKNKDYTGFNIIKSAEHADIILFSTLGLNDQEILSITAHHLVKKAPGKCYLICDRDHPYPVLPGLYAALPKLKFVSTGTWEKYFRTTFYFADHNHYISELKHNTIEPIYLFSFVGSLTSRVRDAIFNTIFKRKDILIHKTQSSNFWENFYWVYGIKKTKDNDEYLLEYAKNILQSKFVLCPKGNGISSYRFFEVMEAGRVPVLLSDTYVLPEIPYDWDDLIIRIKENEVHNLEQIITDNEYKFELMSALNKNVYEELFANKTQYIHQALESLHSKRPIKNQFDYLLFKLYWLGIFKSLNTVKFIHRKLMGALKDLSKRKQFPIPD